MSNFYSPALQTNAPHRIHQSFRKLKHSTMQVIVLRRDFCKGGLFRQLVQIIIQKTHHKCFNNLEIKK